LKWDSQG